MKSLLSKTMATLMLILGFLALSGCGTQDGAIASLKTYEGGLFTISINPEWRIITESDFYPEVPSETVVAFTTPEAYDGFFINVNVVKENLKENVSPIDYGRANINLAAQNLTDYEKVQEAEIDLGGMPGMVHIFQAQLNPTEKLIRFIQLYTTKDKTGYIVTGGMLPSTPQETRDEVGASVTSFRLNQVLQ